MQLDETPTLFLEFHGSKATVDHQAELASKKIISFNFVLPLLVHIPS